MRLHRVLGHEAIRLVTPVLHGLRTHVPVLPKVCENIVTVLSDMLGTSVQLFEILLEFFPGHECDHAHLLIAIIVIGIIHICSTLSYPSLLLLWRWHLLLLLTRRFSMLLLGLFGSLWKFLHGVRA